MNINSKKGQNETVGFVLIVMLVVIVAVIFLGIALRKDSPNIATDAEIQNFLTASSQYTSKCYLDNVPKYRRITDLEKDCNYKNFEQIKCPEGMNACDVLNKTYSDLLQEFRPGGKVLSYYKLDFYYLSAPESSGGTRTPFGTSLVFGNTTGCSSKRGATSEISGNEDNSNLVTQIEVCELE